MGQEVMERVSLPPVAVSPQPEPAARKPAPQAGAGVSTLHRGLALITLVSLFVASLSVYDTLVWSTPAAGITMMVGFGLALVLAIMALVVRTGRRMVVVDIAVLVCALLVRLPEFVVSLRGGGYVNDEGPLIDLGGSLLRHGKDPYTGLWANAYSPHQTGFTQTLAGHVIDHYDYPPMPSVWAALVRTVAPGVPQAAVACVAALLVTNVLLFVLLPRPWRSAATLLCFGLGVYLIPFARAGYPEVLALPLLVMAVYRWTRIGAGGRLGRLGLLSAVCLGAAICTQQMAWFLAPFLVVGVLMCRLGDQPRAVAWRVTLRYCLVVVATAAVINLPFFVWSPHAWVSGVLAPLVVPLVPHGQGLIAISYYVTGGTGALAFYGYAAAALAVGLLALFATRVRVLGPAMSVLPWAAFYLSDRSSAKYFFIMMPIWFVCLATVPLRDFARAYQPRLRFSWARGRRARIAVTLLAVAPAVALTAVAMASPQPLRMSIVSVQTDKSAMMKQVEVDVTNESGQAISPHFSMSSGYAMSRFWVVSSGPATLAPGQEADYVIVPSTPGSSRSLNDGKVLLRAVSDAPATLSSVRIP